jgi:hypothetical protein
MRIEELNEYEIELLVALRKEAEHLVKGVPKEQHAELLSQLYCWRDNKIVDDLRKKIQ